MKELLKYLDNEIEELEEEWGMTCLTLYKAGELATLKKIREKILDK